MKAALFRKLTIDGKNYYQLYDISDNFEVTDKFGNFNNRKECDYFYLPLDNEIYEKLIYTKYLIFCDGKDASFKVVTNNVLKEIFPKFNEKFHDLDEVDISEFDEMEEQFDLITEDVFFQDEPIVEVLQIINRNQDIMNSDAPEYVKRNLKDNIIIYGLPGTGKNTLINSLKNNLDVPYADLALSPDIQTNVNRIAAELAKTADGDFDSLRNGIVFIRDNFNELACVNDELLDNPYLPLMTLLGSEIKITNESSNFSIDLNDLTFITVMNIPSFSELEEYLMDTEDMPNMHLIAFNELTPSEQKLVLKNNKNSIINIYREILSTSGRTLKVYDAFIDDLILLAKRLDGGMHMINSVISKMIKCEWHSSKNITLTPNKLKEVVKYIELDEEMQQKKEKLPVDNRKNNESQELDDNLEQLVNIVKQTVCAQDEHIKRILHTILKNSFAANSKDLENPKRYIKNILIRGETGNGKTAILNEISKLLKVPIFIADATAYTEEGYVGASVKDMLRDLYLAANGNLEKAERGILVIDEIDKKAKEKNANTDVSRQAVLNSLLKIIEGTIVPLKIGEGYNAKEIMFDTSRLTVICTGAFEDIEQIRDQRLKSRVKKKVGYEFSNTNSVNSLTNNNAQEIIDEDYVNFGMARQFMGRFGVIVNLNKLTVENHKTIMQNSKTSELVIQKKLSELEGLTLTYEESFYDMLAHKSYDKKIGARGIERAFQDVLKAINFMDISAKDYQEVIFTGECVDDPSKIILVPREKGKKLIKRQI